MRTRGAAPSASSGGGGTIATDTTRPSAGASTSPSRIGTARSGSRKKKAQNSAAATPSHSSADQMNQPTSPAASAPAMKGRPARCGRASTEAVVSRRLMVAAL